MGNKTKKLKNALKNQQQKGNTSKGEDIRVTKQAQIKKLNGWRKPVTDWEGQVMGSLDKLLVEIKKGYDIDEDTTGVLAEHVMKRIKLYQEVAELTGVPLTLGEATWAIQCEYIYQRQLFQQDTMTEESLRDVNVHNLKYVIEQTYNRKGNPPFEELKKHIYDTTDVSKIPNTEDKSELEAIYTEMFEQAVNELKNTLETK